MSIYKRILGLPEDRLNNSEYLAFMQAVINFLPSDETAFPETAVRMDFLFETVQKLKEEVELLTDAIVESRIAQETESAQETEGNRSNLAVYLMSRISQARSIFLEAERDAGKYLYNVVKPYFGISRLPVGQKTAQIQGLLIDLKKEENQPYVSILGLEGYVDELEKLNNAYVSLINQRLQNRAANKKESGAVIRARMSEMYEDLVLFIQSYNIIHPNEVTEALVDNLNQLITETVIAFKSRAKRSKKNNKPTED